MSSTNSGPAQTQTQNLQPVMGPPGTSYDPSGVAITGGVIAALPVAAVDFRRAENLHACIGDSRVSAGGVDPAVGPNLFTGLCLRSGGRMAYGGRFAGGGFTLEQQRDSFLPQVLALTGSRKPGRCILGFVTNSLAANAGVGWSISTTATVLQQMVSALLAANIRPVLITDTPRPDNATVNGNVQTWNAWVRGYAESNGLHLIDFNAVSIDPATGGWLSGYSSDSIHPVESAIAAMSAAVVGGYTATLPLFNVRRARSADASNLIPSGQGLFLSDTNSDGLADGLSNFSTGITYSIVNDGLCAGKWQRMQRTVGASGVALARFDITTTKAAGTLLEFAGRIRTSGIAGGQGVFASFELRKSGVSVVSPAPVSGVSQDLTDAVFGGVFEVPAGGIDALRVNLQLGAPVSGAGGSADFSEYTVTDLTALGL